MKPRAKVIGFSQHDCETWYMCPICGKKFGSWALSTQKINENGTEKYCPFCKTELSGMG